MVEALWTLIPTVIVLYLFAISWQTLNTVDYTSVANGQQPDVQIHVLAGQFQWQFEYLDAQGKHLATQTKPFGDGGGMAVPVGKKVYVTLSSGDVIHAWYVPRFLFKRDVIPGQTNHFEFTVDPAEAGQTFRGQCAELCGTGHRTMLFNVIAMTQSDYDAWLGKLVADANATPPPAPVRRRDAPAEREEHRLRRARPQRDGQRAIRDRLQEQRPGDDHPRRRHQGRQRQRRRRPAADRGRQRRGRTSTRHFRRARTRSICSVHLGVAAMTGTLTVK